MSKVIFGAFYEGSTLYIEAYDPENLLDLNMRFESVSPADVHNPTHVEKQQFQNSLTTAIRAILPKFDEAALRYQGPSRSQHLPGGSKIRKIREMTPWSEFILTTIENLGGISFEQKSKRSKPSTNKKKGVQKGPNYNSALKYTVTYLSTGLSAKSCHAFAAALELGNTKTDYITWVKRFESNIIRKGGGKVNTQARSLIAKKVAQIPF